MVTKQIDLLAPPPLPEWACDLTGVRAACVAQGHHPLGGARIKGGPETCGECAYHRCAIVRATPGPDGDLRLTWAACALFKGVAL